MELSVIIPTHARPARVRACVEALAGQDVPGPFEVLIGCDGHDPESERAATDAWSTAGAPRERLTVVQCNRQGQAGVRNELLRLAKGRSLVFLNDDMVPLEGHLRAHLLAQRRAERDNRPALVIGASPWKTHDPDTLLHRLIRETSMIFFNDVMDHAPHDPDKDWGFRHAWLLNLSAPTGLVREAGGFTVFPCTYGYEDDELAFRLREKFGTRVLYEPRARALHDHPISAPDYLRREYSLGYAAVGFARTAPDAAGAMFGRDILTAPERAYAGMFLENEQRNASRLCQGFLTLDQLPADSLAGAGSSPVVSLLSQQCLLLKRYLWRAGLADALAGRAMDATPTLQRLGA